MNSILREKRQIFSDLCIPWDDKIQREFDLEMSKRNNADPQVVANVMSILVPPVRRVQFECESIVGEANAKQTKLVDENALYRGACGSVTWISGLHCALCACRTGI